MRILMINVVCGIRSTGRICTDLATALESQGHEVKIAYGRENVPEQFQKYAVRVGNEFDVRLHGIKARLVDGAGFGSKRATKKFIKWVREYNPDIIHLHNIHGYYINIEILFEYLRTCRKKIIWTLHDCWAFTGHTALCDSVNCERWKKGCYSCPGKKMYPSSFSDRCASNWEKKKQIMRGIPNLTIVTPSIWLSNQVKNSFLSEYPIKVIHNGIDIEKIKYTYSDFREEYNIGNRFLLLGVASSWNNMKGLNDFIALSNRLDEDYKMVLIGLTKKQIKKIPQNIIGIERTNSIKELSQIYSAADLFLNLSYCENYPTVNLEAIACGTCVLTYDTGGSPESAINGIVVKRGDLDSVVKTIKSLKEKRSFGKNNSINIELREIDKNYLTMSYLEIIK